MQTTASDIEHYLPHRGAMRLIDRLLECEGDRIAVELRVPEHGLFHIDGDVPAWVGIEYMAQAVACWAGCQARGQGRTPPIGFLLGTRRYDCTVPAFAAGTVLRVEAQRELLGENGLGVFACRIVAGGQELATANVSVFEPPDALAYMESES